MRPIECYSNYRKYLKDFFNDKKSRIKSYSYRVFCRKAGISSPSRFKEVVSGQRNLTEKTIPLFIKGMDLSAEEGRFFTAMVHFNQSKSDEEKQKYLDEMLVYTRNSSKTKIPISAYEYFSKWYNPVIRELACIIDWRGDYKLLAKSVEPRIKASEARESVKTLIKLGLIYMDDEGRYRQADPVITTGDEVESLSVRALNKEMSLLGTQSLDRFSRDERDVSSLTIGVSGFAYKKIKDEIHSFKERVIRLVREDNESDRVYNMNLQLFPLSCRKGESR